MARRRAAQEPPASADGPDADPAEVARTVVLRRLSAAPRTRHELAVDLVDRGVPQAAIDQVLDRFAEVGLIDDAGFARMWVDSRLRTRGAAPRVLRQELRARGVDEEIVDSVLVSIDTDRQREVAARLVESRRRSVARLEPVVQVRRLTSLLVRRGYSSGMAYEVVRSCLGSDVDGRGPSGSLEERENDVVDDALDIGR